MCCSTEEKKLTAGKDKGHYMKVKFALENLITLERLLDYVICGLTQITHKSQCVVLCCHGEG